MDPDDNDSQGQRLNPEVMHKIRELVARGVSGIYTVKHCLKEYVEKELFVNMEPPPRHNKSYFPTIIDIQNHIHQAQMALATGTLVPLPPVSNMILKVFCQLVAKQANSYGICEDMFKLGTRIRSSSLGTNVNIHVPFCQEPAPEFGHGA